MANYVSNTLLLAGAVQAMHRDELTMRVTFSGNITKKYYMRKVTLEEAQEFLEDDCVSAVLGESVAATYGFVLGSAIEPVAEEQFFSTGDVVLTGVPTQVDGNPALQWVITEVL